MAGWADLGPGARSALIVGIIAVGAAVAIRFGLADRAGPAPEPPLAAAPRSDDSPATQPGAASTASGEAAATPEAAVPEGAAAEVAAETRAEPAGEEVAALAPPETAPPAAEPEPAASAAAPEAASGTAGEAEPAAPEAASGTAEEPEPAAPETAPGTAGEPESAATAAVAPDPAEATPPAAAAEPSPPAATAEAPGTADPDPAASAEETPPAPPPGFDVVRVAPDGSALVAGRAEPGAAVEVLLDGAPVHTATADASGRFAALFGLPPSEAPRLLSLRTTGGEPVESLESVVLAPFAPPASTATAEAAPDTPATAPAAAEEEVAAMPGTADPAGAAEAGGPAAGTAPEDVASAEPAEPPADALAAGGGAPVLLLADEEGARLLQPPETPEGPAPGLVIDTVTTDSGGRVSVAGRAEGGGFARIYADNVEVATVEIDAGGWRAPLPDDAPQRFALRIDQLDSAGGVVARTETEVTRETREQLEGLLVEEVRAGAAGAVVVTVERGFTLWAIARENYGDGRLYVKVFEANRSQIRDPDLIYPGQVFSVPIEDTEPG